MSSETSHVDTCEWCGTQFELSEYKDSQRFCSRSCAAKQMHDEKRNHVGGAAVEQRRKALERDEYECQRCGVSVEGGHRKSQKSAEVHHIIPKAAGGSDHINNLVTLCLRCHPKVHRRMGELPEHHPELLEELQEVVCDESG